MTTTDHDTAGLVSGADRVTGAVGDGNTGSEAEPQETLSGTEKSADCVYPSQGPTSRDVAANRDQVGRFVAADETQRFLTKVDTSGECWLWTGGLDRDGYGRFQARRPGGGWGYVPAHRWAWEAEHGQPIPLGLTLDHRCHTTDPTCPGGRACPHRRCVRPEHLDVVTTAENRRRAHARRRTTEDHQP